MTRLITEWIQDLENNVEKNEAYLMNHTGIGYFDIAANTAQKSSSELQHAIKNLTVAVVPITAGLGVIQTFCQSVMAILNHMQVKSFVTRNTDVDGIHEAYMRNADIVYLADDNRFIAINLNTRKLADNNLATAMGYVNVLENMNGSLKGQEVLLLGYGIVGQEIFRCLKQKGAHIAVYDKDVKKLMLLKKYHIRLLDSALEIKNYRLLIDATSEGAWLNQDMLHENAIMAALGVPLSLTAEAISKLNGSIVHDYLEIGVAAMLGLVL